MRGVKNGLSKGRETNYEQRKDERKILCAKVERKIFKSKNEREKCLGKNAA